MKILNVAEKNDAAKNIADILSSGQLSRREGLSKFNKIYEFGFCLNGVPVNMVMTSVSGHLMNLDFPPGYKAWHTSDPLALFDAPVKKVVIKEGEPLKLTLLREVRSCQKLIIWTDCDREGENIGLEVVDVCKEIKPDIPVFRAKFSEITPAAIHRAIADLTLPDQRVSDAVDARQELDLRIGAAFTRFQTMRLRRVFPQTLADRLISYGPCQFPTLGFVVERFREVDRFVPEPFWRIVVTVERDGKSVDFQWKRGRIFDEDCCRAYYEHILENSHGRVTEVTKRPKSRWRPVALDTVELEKLATRKLRIGAKATMQLAERLYTQGFISYPRTETNIFPPDMDLTSLVHTQIQDNRWAAFASRILETGINPRNGKSTDKAHPPIHPLKPGRNLQGDEARLYELITRHFLACLSADAQGAETLVQLCVGKSAVPAPGGNSTEGGEMFEAKGLVILQSNYLDVYIYDRWTEKEMPDFRLADCIVPTNIEMATGHTTPPPLLTEADLISLMDRHGIGTDATHADHIETIKQRLYVGLEQNKFLVPGQLGMGLVEGYDSMGFEMSKPNLRAELEADLRLICDGRKSKGEVLRHHLDKYKRLFQLVVTQAFQLDRALSSRLEVPAEDISCTASVVGSNFSFADQHIRTLPVIACPSCFRDVNLRQRRPQQRPLTEVASNAALHCIQHEVYNPLCQVLWFLSCSGFPSCRYAVWFPESVLNVRLAVGPDGPEQCSNCPTHLTVSNTSVQRPLKLAFRLRLHTQIPNGYCQDEPEKEYVTCIFCDMNFQNALGVRINPTSRTGSYDSSVHPSPSPSAPSPPRPIRSRGIDLSPLSPPGSRSFSTSSNSNNLSSSTTHPACVSRPNVLEPQRACGNQLMAQNAEAAVICDCGREAILLTVKKTGPNQGRLFYRCSGDTGSAESCGFFQWKTHIDSLNPIASSTQNPHSFSYVNPFNRVPSKFLTCNPSCPVSQVCFPASNSSRFGQSGSSSTVLCRCGEPAKLLKVLKQTSNHGREFFTCPNGRPESSGGQNSGCNFFAWADSIETPAFASTPHSVTTSSIPDSTGFSSAYSSVDGNVSLGYVPVWPPPAPTCSRGGRARLRSSSLGSCVRSRSGPSGVRKCGLCGEPGHTRTRCSRAL